MCVPVSTVKRENFVFQLNFSTLLIPVTSDLIYSCGVTSTIYYYNIFFPLEQGFSTFWYLRTPNQDCTPLRTPKSKFYPPRVPPNQKFYPNKLVFSGFKNLAYPLWASHVPLGVRVPQVENRCSRIYTLCKVFNMTLKFRSLKNYRKTLRTKSINILYRDKRLF